MSPFGKGGFFIACLFAAARHRDPAPVLLSRWPKASVSRSRFTSDRNSKGNVNSTRAHPERTRIDIPPLSPFGKGGFFIVRLLAAARHRDPAPVLLSRWPKASVSRSRFTSDRNSKGNVNSTRAHPERTRIDIPPLFLFGKGGFFVARLLAAARHRPPDTRPGFPADR